MVHILKYGAKMNDIIVFAACWNEKDLLKASLEQLDMIDPAETIICDGCFDPKEPLHSTDGTYEMLKEYVQKRRREGRRIQLIEPQRKSLIGAFFSILRMNSKDNPLHMLKPSRWRTLFYTLSLHEYRRNQAITFNSMISRSSLWKPERWFMTYDSDQFYPDDFIGSLEITNKKTVYGLLTAHEKTFFKDFSHYTDEYESRRSNNMPHKIYGNTVICLTRNVAIEGFVRRRSYEEIVPSKPVGACFHYKFPRNGRLEQSYTLGDRRKPQISSYKMKIFTGKHPSIIKRYFEKDIGQAEGTKKRKDTPLVSVIMPVYNGQRYLKEAVDSILSQTYANFEFIIVNDCSTDGTKNILESYDDKRMRILNNKRNKGHTFSRNMGIKAAKGDYIAVMDADDISEKIRLESQIEFLEDNRDIFLCGTGFSVLDKHSDALGVISKGMRPEEVEERLKRSNCLCHGSVMFRNDRKTFYREKFWYSPDYDLYLTLLSRGKRLANLEDALYNLRITDSSLSGKCRTCQVLFSKKAREFYLERAASKKDSYAQFNPDDLIGEGMKHRRFVSTDYIIILALLGSDKALARRKIISMMIKNKFISLNLINLLIKTFIPDF